MNPYSPIFDSLCRTVRSGRRVALCVLVETRGSTPQSPGAMMLVHETLETEGTLGGGCVEAEVKRRAGELLRAGESRALTFLLNHDYGWDDGLVCGGRMEIVVRSLTQGEELAPFEAALEAIGERRAATVLLCAPREDGQVVEYRVHAHVSPRLVIAGGGHVGLALAKIARDLDFQVTVVDDRVDFANPERFPPPIEPLAADIESTLRRMPMDEQTYVVIVTRGHKHDKQALGAVIDKPARYIGMIGSKRKIRLILDDLQAAGGSPDSIGRVHAPIGLPIGSVTVAEIAISIAAQLIQVRREKDEPIVEGPIDPTGGRELRKGNE